MNTSDLINRHNGQRLLGSLNADEQQHFLHALVMFVRNKDDLISFWSQRAEDVYGFTAQEAISQSPHNLLHTVFPTGKATVFDELFRTGEWRGPLQHRTRNGQWLNVVTHWILHRGNQHEPQSIIEITKKHSPCDLHHATLLDYNEVLSQKVTDVGIDLVLTTQSLTHEAEARAVAEVAASRANENTALTEGKLRTLVDHLAVCVYMVDSENRLLLVNRHWEKALGLKEAETIGRSIYEVFSEETADKFADHNRRVISAGETMQFEEVVMLGDGLHHFVSVKAPLRAADGSIYGICGISTDVTTVVKQHAPAKVESTVKIYSRIANDLRPSLQSLISFSDRLLNEASAGPFPNANPLVKRFSFPSIEKSQQSTVQDAAKRLKETLSVCEAFARLALVRETKSFFNVGEAIGIIVATLASEFGDQGCALNFSGVATTGPNFAGNWSTFHDLLKCLLRSILDRCNSLQGNAVTLEAQLLPTIFKLRIRDNGEPIPPERQCSMWDAEIGELRLVFARNAALQLGIDIDFQRIEGFNEFRLLLLIGKS